MTLLGGVRVMPKPRKRVATGMSVQDVLNMPISKFQNYTPTEQREIVSRLASAANKRLRTLEKSNINNSATLRLYQSGGKISVRGKAGSELTKELIRAREFLTNKFSSKKEWNKTIKNIKNKNADFSGMSESEIARAFAAYDLARETDAEIVNKLNKYTLMDFIDGLQVIEGVTDPNEIHRRVVDFARSEYERQRREYYEQNTRFSDTLENDIPKRISRKRKRKRK